MNDLPQYALGYHEAWEVYLHGLRASRQAAGSPMTHTEELIHLERYFTENRKNASKAKLCPSCNEAIAQALIDGRDPFATPEFAREAIENFNASFRNGVRKHAKKKP